MRFSCFLFGLILICSSCYRSKTTSLTIEVKNTAGNLVPGVLVEVLAEPMANTEEIPLLIDYEKATNNNGIAFFNLNEVYKAGQTGVAIVKVSVQSNNLYDETVVELNEGIDNKADLILQ